MRRRVTPCTLLVALTALAGLLLANSLAAYTVHLKDGSAIVAKKKYTVRGDLAILILPSGTESALALAEIDVARTEAANQNDLGTAIVIEDGKATDLTRSAPPPSSKQTLKQLLEERAAAGGSTNAGAVALDAGSAQRDSDRQPASQAGQAPMRNVELSTAIRTFVFARGITNLEVQQGPSSRRPRLVYETSTESQVFRAILASAGALLDIRDRRAGEVEALEVICEAPTGGRAGRFTLTPPQASDLLSGRIATSSYFFQNVQF